MFDCPKIYGMPFYRLKQTFTSYVGSFAVDTIVNGVLLKHFAPPLMRKPSNDN